MFLISFQEKLPLGYIYVQFLCQSSIQATRFTDENLECPAQKPNRYHVLRSQCYTMHTYTSCLWIPWWWGLMEAESFAPVMLTTKLRNSDFQQQTVFVLRSLVSVSVSHKFHFSRFEILMLSFAIHPPFLRVFVRRKWRKRKSRGTTYTRISLLLLHHTTRVIMAHVNMTGIKMSVMRISSGGSSQWTFSEVQFEKNCLWIPVIKPSVRGFGQKQLAFLASCSVHWVKLS